MREHGIKETIKTFFLYAFAYNCNSQPVSNEIKNVSATEHLKSKVIQDICSKKYSICSSYTYKLCAVRKEMGKFVFKEFSNDCLLFLVNMCEYPGIEWAIIDQKPCIETNLRRVEGNDTNASESEPQPGTEAEDMEAVAANATGSGESQRSQETPESATDTNGTGSGETAAALRAASSSTLSTTHYDIDEAMDGHRCPQHCPLMYEPVCVNINRGYGKHFRLLHFSNHCEADRHYCANWETVYKPPPELDEPLFVRPSNAAWSFCASGSYMNFMTFAQTATSMAHYGWLAGQQRGQHIMEPWERIPGNG